MNNFQNMYDMCKIMSNFSTKIKSAPVAEVHMSDRYYTFRVSSTGDSIRLFLNDRQQLFDVVIADNTTKGKYAYNMYSKNRWLVIGNTLQRLRPATDINSTGDDYDITNILDESVFNFEMDLSVDDPFLRDLYKLHGCVVRGTQDIKAVSIEVSRIHEHNVNLESLIDKMNTNFFFWKCKDEL